MGGLQPRWITSSSILHLLLSLIQQLLTIEISYRDFLITSLAPDVQRVDNPVQRKNIFLLDKAIGFQLSFFLKNWDRMALKGQVHGLAHAHLSKCCFLSGHAESSMHAI